MRRRRDAAARLDTCNIYIDIYNYYQSETVRLYSGHRKPVFTHNMSLPVRGLNKEAVFQGSKEGNTSRNMSMIKKRVK